jgi:hypothetical protein
MASPHVVPDWIEIRKGNAPVLLLAPYGGRRAAPRHPAAVTKSTTCTIKPGASPGAHRPCDSDPFMLPYAPWARRRIYRG